ncbi:MAG: thiamine diphosphokinase [Coriobacteriia bacterium]|nr:thiamine diphosphokinase [Coriobacteriia bacterium]
MRALVVGAAPEPGREAFYSELLRDAERVVAADGGSALALALGRKPDVAVGDFDSSPPGTMEALSAAGVRVVGHPSVKDETDLDLAVSVARADGAAAVTLTAAFSARLDHTLAAFGTLLRASDLLADVQEPGFSAWVAGGRRRVLSLTAPAGATVSVIAPGGASGVTLEGFAYALTDASLEPMSSLGVSNVTTGEPAIVRVRGGSVIVIANAEAGLGRVRLSEER